MRKYYISHLFNLMVFKHNVTNRSIFCMCRSTPTHPIRQPRVEAGAPIGREPSLEMASTSTGGFWILNRSAQKKVLPHGELFGFNVGSWIETASGWGFLQCKKTY